MKNNLQIDMNTSMIIPTYNRPGDLREALDSIQAQNKLPSEIIIVVDNGGNYKDNYQVYKEFKDKLEGTSLKIFKNQAKKGTSTSRNIGISESNGDILIFIDDDVILNKDYVEKIVNIFLNDVEKDIGGLTGGFNEIDLYKKELQLKKYKRLFFNFKHIIRKCFFLPTKGNGKLKKSGFPSEYFWDNEVKPLEWMRGCNMAFRREVFKEFRFDEDLIRGQDVDFSFRVSSKYKILYVPEIKLLHKLSPSARKNKRDFAIDIIKSHRQLHKKSFPQDLKHLIPFWWSHYFGIPVDCLLSRDIESFKYSSLELFKELRLNLFNQ